MASPNKETTTKYGSGSDFFGDPNAPRRESSVSPIWPSQPSQPSQPSSPSVSQPSQPSAPSIPSDAKRELEIIDNVAYVNYYKVTPEGGRIQLQRQEVAPTYQEQAKQAFASGSASITGTFENPQIQVTRQPEKQADSFIEQQRAIDEANKAGYGFTSVTGQNIDFAFGGQSIVPRSTEKGEQTYRISIIGQPSTLPNQVAEYERSREKLVRSIFESGIGGAAVPIGITATRFFEVGSGTVTNILEGKGIKSFDEAYKEQYESMIHGIATKPAGKAIFEELAVPAAFNIGVPAVLIGAGAVGGAVGLGLGAMQVVETIKEPTTKNIGSTLFLAGLVGLGAGYAKRTEITKGFDNLIRGKPAREIKPMKPFLGEVKEVKIDNIISNKDIGRINKIDKAGYEEFTRSFKTKVNKLTEEMQIGTEIKFTDIKKDFETRVRKQPIETNYLGEPTEVKIDREITNKDIERINKIDNAAFEEASRARTAKIGELTEGIMKPTGKQEPKLDLTDLVPKQEPTIIAEIRQPYSALKESGFKGVFDDLPKNVAEKTIADIEKGFEAEKIKPFESIFGDQPKSFAQSEIDKITKDLVGFGKPEPKQPRFFDYTKPEVKRPSEKSIESKGLQLLQETKTKKPINIDKLLERNLEVREVRQRKAREPKEITLKKMNIGMKEQKPSFGFLYGKGREKSIEKSMNDFAGTLNISGSKSKVKTSQEISIRQLEKQMQKQDEFGLSLLGSGISKASQKQGSFTDIFQISRQKTDTRPKYGSFPDLTGGYSDRLFGRRSRVKEKTKYTPSIVGLAYNVKRGNVDRLLTGTEVRGFATSRRRPKKKKR